MKELFLSYCKWKKGNWEYFNANCKNIPIAHAAETFKEQSTYYSQSWRKKISGSLKLWKTK